LPHEADELKLIFCQDNVQFFYPVQYGESIFKISN
jgi:hypothetical protein